jgi:hypothetical protein
LPTTVTDPVGHATVATHDYRVFQPSQVTDPNDNITQFAFDELGFLIEVAVLGKDLGSSTYEGDDPDTPSVTYTYDFDAFEQTGDPVSVTTERRLYHVNDPDDGTDDSTIKTVEFSDGFGRLVQTRTLAEDTIYGDDQGLDPFGDSGLDPDMTESLADAVAWTRTTEPDNVVVSGWTVYDPSLKSVGRNLDYPATETAN